MMRILSWSSGLGCDKPLTSDFSMSKDQVASLACVPLPVSVKRKRSPSRDQTEPIPVDSAAKQIDQDRHSIIYTDVLIPEHPISQQSACATPTENVHQPKTMEVNVSHSQSAVPSIAPELTDKQLQRMRQTISSQLNLEILVKHKELRLIDQEMAKCQVALEQLRRCTEIPYPATQKPSLSLSQGRGPAVRKINEPYPADSPAPWGVTDGPYARHYSQWLLPDRRFDGGEPDMAVAQLAGGVTTSGRSTRGNYVDVGAKSVKARSQRGSLQSLPAGYGQPKEKATGPMILKRKSDGAMVKLVCPDCGRHDFGSAQGFINHCRIGHGRSFASHDAAAEACGEPVEYNENGTVKGSEPISTPSTTSVHPLVRSAKLVSQSADFSHISMRGGHITDAASQFREESLRKSVPAGFSASSQTPHLSSFVKNQGLGLDLQGLVAEAKTKVDSLESEYEAEETDVDSPAPTVTGRHPQIAGSKRPVEAVATDSSSPVLNSRMRFPPPSRRSEMSTISVMQPDHPLHSSFQGVLPSPTNESTQAPSLVDDDEEYDPQSPASSNEIDDADVDVDFEVHDDEHGDRVTNLEGSHMTRPTQTCAPAVPARAQPPQEPVQRRVITVQDEEKRGAFVSPSPAPEGSDRKRRKVERK